MQEMTDQEKNYIERQRNWQNQSANQLSTANNFLLTISTGLLAFCFDKKSFSKLVCNADIFQTFYFWSLILLTVSIVCGILVLVSRLYDFRITRHIALTRQRFYIKNKDKTEKNASVLPDYDFIYPDFFQQLETIFKVIFIKIDFLTKEEMKKVKEVPELKAKFNSLREFSYSLGAISWKLTKMQGLCFLIATIFYILSLWSK